MTIIERIERGLIVVIRFTGVILIVDTRFEVHVIICDIVTTVGHIDDGATNQNTLLDD
jgi:hypothetical protein